MYTRFVISALALSLSVTAQAATFSNTYFFGDSLSDSGAYVGIVPVGGKFTTNPAMVWTELLASAYGQTATPNNSNNPFIATPGTNYSQGGAQVNTTPGFGSPPTTLARSVKQQVDAFISANPAADSKALYSVWAGANDIFYQFQFAGTLSLAKDAALAGNFAVAEAYSNAAVQQAGLNVGPSAMAMTTVANAALAASQANSAAGVAGAAAQASGVAQTYVGQAAKDMVAQLARLKAAGARYIIVPNLPNIGDTPGGAQGADPVAQATARATFNSLSSLFNTTLAYGLKQANIEVISININGVMKEIMASPAQYGIVNTTTKACNTASSLICTPTDLVVANAGDTYFFADDVHPTAVVHKMLAQYTQAVIDAPQQMAQLPNAALQTARSQRQVLDNRLQLLRTNSPAQSGVDLYVDLGNTMVDRNSIDGSSGTSGSNLRLTVGGDRKIGSAMHVGFSFSGASGSHDFSRNKGGFDLNEVAFSLYGGLIEGGFYGQTYAQLGVQGFDNISRNVELGTTTRQERSDARGRRLGLGVSGGYDMKLGPLQTGPVLGLHFQDATVGAFHEKSADSVAMGFEEQTVKSLIGRLGWALSMEHVAGAVSWRPFAELAWENEFKNDEREVRGGLTSMGNTFGMPVAAMDGSYLDYRLGVSANVKKWQAVFSYSGVSGLDQGSFRALNLSVATHF